MNSPAPAAASSAAVSSAASSVVQAPAIPYRTTSSVSVGGMADASAIMAFVFVALVGFLIYARRRGWAAVGATPANRAASVAGLSVVSTKRLSAASVGHVVSYRGNEYLIVESGKGFQTAIVPLRPGEKPKDEAS